MKLDKVRKLPDFLAVAEPNDGGGCARLKHIIAIIIMDLVD
jgi:hypothetical protein